MGDGQDGRSHKPGQPHHRAHPEHHSHHKEVQVVPASFLQAAKQETEHPTAQEPGPRRKPDSNPTRARVNFLKIQNKTWRQIRRYPGFAQAPCVKIWPEFRQSGFGAFVWYLLPPQKRPQPNSHFFHSFRKKFPPLASKLCSVQVRVIPGSSSN